MPNEFKVKNGLIVDQGGASVTGSSTISGSLAINASGSSVFTVDGTAGRLFSVDDSLSGSLFSVNTAAGLPVMEAFSDNTVRIGQYGKRTLFVSQSFVGVGKETGLNATLDVSGSAVITGSLSVSSGITGSLFGSASYAFTASYALNAGGASIDTGSFATTGSNRFIGNQIITGSLIISGSNTLIGNTVLSGSLNVSGSTTIVGTTNFSNSSTTITGSFLVSGSTTQIGNNNLLGNTSLSGSLTVSGSQGSIIPTIQIYGDLKQSGYHRFDPVSTNIDTSISASYIYVSGSTQDLYFSQNGSGYANTTRLRWIEGNLYTGLLGGGVLSSTPGSTTFNLSSGSGIIVSLNAVTSSANPFPTIQYVSWPAYTNQPITNSGSAKITYISVTSAGAINQQVVPIGSTDINQYDTQIEIGVVLHLTSSVSTGVYNTPQLAYGYAQQTDDFIRAFGPIKISGHTLSPSGSSPTLRIIKTGGTAYNKGANYVNNPNHPSTVIDLATNISKIYRYYISGSTPVIDSGVGGAGYTDIDNKNYVDTATGNLATVGASNWSIQRVFWIPNSPTNAFLVYYGNARYGTLLNAINAKDSEVFIEAPNTAANAIFLGYIIIQGGGTATPARDLNDPAETTIIPGGLFRSVGGVGSSGTAPVSSTLAGLSDVSIASRVSNDLLIYNGSQWINSKTLTGTYNIVGSLSSTGTISASAFSGSYFGTASYALTASVALAYVLNSSTGSMLSPYVLSSNTASFITNSQTSSMSVLSASFATTASSAENFTVRGTLTAQTLIVQTITSSTEYITGSTQFGSLQSNTHQFTGSVSVSGSLSVNSGVINNLTSSYAMTASYWSGSVLNSTSASYAATASFAPNYVLNSSTASFVTNNQTGSFITNSQTSSMSVATASYVLNSISSSYAATSSLPLRGLITASVAGATITFTKGDSTTFDLTIAQSGTVSTASYVTSSGVYGPFGANSILTASYATTAALAPNYVLNSVTQSMLATYVLNSSTSSFITNSQTSSFITNSQTSSMTVLSASFASTASLAPNYVLNSSTSSFVTNSQTSSFVTNLQTSSMTVLSASFASTASLAPNYVLNSSTSSFITNSQTGSFITNLQTSSMSVLSSSFASTSSYINPLIQNITITGSINISGSTIQTGSFTLNNNAGTVTTFAGDPFTFARIGNTLSFFAAAGGVGNNSVIYSNSTLRLGGGSNAAQIVLDSSGNKTGINKASPNAALDVNGNTIITGSLEVTLGITGSLFGTSSWSQNAISSSFASTASLAPLYVLTSATSSMLTPYVLTSVTASMLSSYVLSTNTASLVTNSQTSSMSVLSASFAATASSADNFTVRGTLTAQTIVVQTITSSTDYVTGSTRFGSLQTNTHQFTGSVSITGSLNISNSLDISGTARTGDTLTVGTSTFTNKLNGQFGTFGIQSYAVNNGFMSDNMYYNGSSWTRIATGYGMGFQFFNGQVQFHGIATGTGNFTQNIKFKFDHEGAFVIGNNLAGTLGDYVNATAIFTKNGRLLLGTTTEATYLLDVNGTTRIIGNSQITGSLTVTQGITGSLQGTSSWAQNAVTSSYILNAVSSSFASTASYWSGSILNATSASFANTASYATTASYVLGGSSTIVIQDEGSAQGSAGTINFTGTGVTATVAGGTATVNIPGGGGSAFPYTGSAIITGSLIVTGSITSTLGFTGSLFGTSSFTLNIDGGTY